MIETQTNPLGATTAPMPKPTGDYKITTHEVNHEGSRYVFTVADLIGATAKARNPGWSRGGLIRAEAQCLKWCSGYVPRCEITEMRQFMDSDIRTMVHPNERAHRKPFYILEYPNPVTGEMEKKTIGNDGLLRVPFYPIWEVAVLTSQVDGLVEMPVKNENERYMAQIFLFDNWDNIKDTLPRKTSELRAYFLRRLTAAQKAPDAAARTFFSNVALAAVRSCDNFAAWGGMFIRTQTARYNEAQKNAWAWTYGEDAECCFEQLGIARPDLMAQDQYSRMEQMMQAQAEFTATTSKLLSALADKVVDQMPETPETPSADAPPPAPPQEPVVKKQEPESKPAVSMKCLAHTKSGEQCKNDALEDGFCSLPSHNAEAEAERMEAENKGAEA